MDEAQELADRVAIIAGGQIVAEGSPAQLGGRADAASEITFALPPGKSLELPPLARAALEGSPANGSVRLRSDRPVALLSELTAWALEGGVELAGLEVHRPTLEDVYLELTGERCGTAGL